MAAAMLDNVNLSSGSEEESNDDKENESLDSSGSSDRPVPGYLKYEDFSHTPMGLETYSDGLRHPVELRRILTGDLSSELTVSYKGRPGESYRNLSYPKVNKRSSSDVFESPSISVYPTVIPKPPKLFKGIISSSMSQKSALTSSWVEDSSKSLTSELGDFSGHSMMSVSPRKPGRPPTASGSFDPETGAVRYSCRLHCGASLASAKGRRKHEKKHCPNFGKVAPPILKGQRSQLLRQQLAAGSGQEAANGGGDPLAHSLFGQMSAPGHHVVTRERRVYECRYCGKVLKTYEGRRLHEKLQHVAKQHQRPDQAERLSEEAEEISTEDNKQLLIEHLKAAGMDPSCLDERILSQDDNENICEPSIEYGDEDDEDDEEDEFGEAPSSDGIEMSH